MWVRMISTVHGYSSIHITISLLTHKSYYTSQQSNTSAFSISIQEQSTPTPEECDK